MSREVDRRQRRRDRSAPQDVTRLAARANEVSDRLPGTHRVSIQEVDLTSGNAVTVASVGAPAVAGNYVARALDHVQAIAPALGLAAEQPAEFRPDPTVSETSSGAKVVHLQQRYKGIPVFEATQMVRFSPDGSVAETVGTSVTVEGDVDAAPALRPEDAVRRAAEHVSAPEPQATYSVDEPPPASATPTVDLSDFAPAVRASFTNLIEQPTVVDQGPFGADIKASLVWFPVDDRLVLGWNVLITMPRHSGQYSVIVDATDGEILYCRQRMHTVRGRGNVYRVDGDSPRQMIDFPRPLGDYGVPIPSNLPTGFPEDWVEDKATVGNTTQARTADRLLYGGQKDGSGNVTFNPPDAHGDLQQLLNIFYWCCSMHDFLYLFGFREANGNFQHNNFGRGGAASDRLDVFVHPRKVWGTANMGTGADGKVPVMNMGVVYSPGKWRIKRSTGGQAFPDFGDPDDELVPADYDGDGEDELAIWRPADGNWVVRKITTDTWTQWGETGDIPVPADYTGDGKADFAVWRPRNGTWFVKGQAGVQWGERDDRPVPGDYTGDGKADFAVWRPRTGTWFVKGLDPVQWGRDGDIPVPRDYNGDGRTDFAFWRPSTLTWHIKLAATGSEFVEPLGEPGDFPVPADYSGDGKTDIAVWRPRTGTWHIKDATTGATSSVQWGAFGDLPLTCDEDGDGKADLVVWRKSSIAPRHTALDSDIAYHEFMHGVSGRLVGGPQDEGSLGGRQSAGMNEGWSDFLACTVNNKTVVATWSFRAPNGIRGFPYDSKFPDTFGSLGTGRYVVTVKPDKTEEFSPHNVGEIWCATLMEASRRIGKNLMLQLVIDGQKMTVANPSFLNGRNGIRNALKDMRSSGRLTRDAHIAAWWGLWGALAKFGLGPDAKANGTELTGNTADFDPPWRSLRKYMRRKLTDPKTGVRQLMVFAQDFSLKGMMAQLD